MRNWKYQFCLVTVLHQPISKSLFFVTKCDRGILKRKAPAGQCHELKGPP